MKTLLKLIKLAYEIRDAIKDIRDQHTEIDMIHNAEMLTSHRAAIYMGVSERSIKELVYAKEISYCRPTSNRLFISKSSLDEYMRRNEIYSIYTLEKITRAKSKL